MRMSLRPPASTSMRIRVAPASREFSRSSLTTEAGRSTTSPAAIWFATRSERMRMRPMDRLYEEDCCGMTARPGSGGRFGNECARDGISGQRRREMIRKLKSGEYRIYSRHQDPKTGRRKNLGTFATREKAEEHERAIQYFKRH